MKYLLPLFCCAFFAFYSIPLKAFACAGNPDLKVITTLKQAPIEYNHEKTALEIYQTQPQHNMLLLGLTQTRLPRPKIDIRFLTQKKKNESCVSYQAISVQLDLEQKVFIPSEVQSDSCMRASIVEHEAEHLRINKSLSEETLEALKAALQQELSEEGRVLSNPQNMPEVKLELTQMAYAKIYEAYNQLRLKIVEENQALDTPETYMELYETCPVEQEELTTQFYNQYVEARKEACRALKEEDQKSECLKAVQNITFTKIWEQD